MLVRRKLKLILMKRHVVPELGVFIFTVHLFAEENEGEMNKRSTGRTGTTQSTSMSASRVKPRISEMSTDEALKYAGRAALFGLALIYLQAASREDLQSNPNWTISRVMVYDYNAPVTNFVLFPAFLTISLLYAVKHRFSARIRAGAAVAVAGGMGLMAYPVTTHETEHVVCALVVFLSSYFWYPECSSRQFQTFAASSVFFLGGFAMESWFHRSKSVGEREISWLSFGPSISCVSGELGIFTTWGIMVQNEKSDGKEERRLPA